MQDDLQSENATGSTFADVPVLVTVTVGRARPTIATLISLSDDTVIELDRGLDEPVEIYVGDKLIAHGTLEEVASEGPSRLGVRITEVVRAGPAR